MLLKCFVLLCTVVSCLSKRRIGSRCIFKEDVAGTCRPITECPYALTLLYVEERKPPMCWWQGETRIVCCPSNESELRLGHGRLYDPPSEGVIRSGSTICRYEGEWHHCRPIEPERPPLNETGCPALDKPAPPPTLSPVQRIAWNKCVENLRYVDQCIAEPGDRDRLIRRYECGIQDQPFRIAGGRPAESKEFPHMVALGVAEKRVEGSSFDMEWVAVGALVSDRFVLTAAHVLIDPAGRPLRYALLGSLDKDVRNGLLLTIVRRIPHPLYRWPNNQHDIALLELDRPVPLSSHVRPICLPVPGQDTDRDTQRLHIAYWVRTGDSANATELNTAQVSLLDYSECQTKLGSFNFQYNSSTMLCVKGSNRGTGRKIITPNTCPGDSGGPLMSVLSNVKCSYRVDGVLSFGANCGGGSASVYTPVGRYLHWIVRNVWPDEWKQRLTDESHIIHFP